MHAAGPFQMEIGSYRVGFVEAESLIKSQGAIKSSNLEANGTFTDRGFSLELADQEHCRFLCHGIVAGSQGPLIESPPCLQQDHSTDGFIVQQHEPIIRSRCERSVVAGKTLIHQLDERLLLLCAQGDKLKFLRVNRIKEAIDKFLVIRSSGAKCEYLTHCWRGVACNAFLADRSKGLSRGVLRLNRHLRRREGAASSSPPNSKPLGEGSQTGPRLLRAQSSCLRSRRG